MAERRVPTGVELVLRPARPEDGNQIAWVLADAFGVNEPSLPEPAGRPDPGAPDQGEPDQGKPDPCAPHTWVAVERTENGVERVVGVTSYRLRGQWFGGRRVGCAALSNVAVAIGHRGGGVGYRLVRAALTEARELGAALTALIPSVHTFYERLDCGVAGWRSRADLSTDQLRQHLPRRPADRLVRRARRGDADAVATVVAERARRGSGLIDHQPLPTDRDLIDDLPAEDPSGPGRWVSELDGVVTGWAEVTRRPARTPGIPYELIVDDMVGASVADEIALWLDVVAGHPAGLLARAGYPRGGLLERHLQRQVGAVSHETWMLGLLDLDLALADRGYPVGLSCEVDLLVTAADGSQRRRLLRVRDGVASVNPADPVDEENATESGRRSGVRLDAATLASVYGGHLDPFVGARLGLIEASDCELERLRSLFAGPAGAPARGF